MMDGSSYGTSAVGRRWWTTSTWSTVRVLAPPTTANGHRSSIRSAPRIHTATSCILAWARTRGYARIRWTYSYAAATTVLDLHFLLYSRHPALVMYSCVYLSCCAFSHRLFPVGLLVFRYSCFRYRQSSSSTPTTGDWSGMLTIMCWMSWRSALFICCPRHF